MRTVTLEVASREEVTRRALAAFKGKKQQSRISFATPELLLKVLTAKRWELKVLGRAGIDYGPDTRPGADIFLADINDDGRADFCRFVGQRSTKQTFVCTLATSSGFGPREVRAEILRPDGDTPGLMVDRR